MLVPPPTVVPPVGTANDGYGGYPQGSPGGGGVDPAKGIYTDAGQINEIDYGLDGYQGKAKNNDFFNIY